jgi:hypothetical protein
VKIESVRNFKHGEVFTATGMSGAGMDTLMVSRGRRPIFLLAVRRCSQILGLEGSGNRVGPH